MSGAATIEELARRAQERGGRSGRRADGAFFTDADVASHLASRALGAWLLERAAISSASAADELLSTGGDALAAVVHACAADADAGRRVAEAVAELHVLDPTCGAGSFLAAAWILLRELDVRLDLGAACPAALLGVDRAQEAVDACRETLELVLAEHPARCRHAHCRPSIELGDAEAAGVLPPAHVLLGNPPFVRARVNAAPRDLDTRLVPNRSAWIVERALEAALPGARAAFVLPISTSCTDAFVPARDCWSNRCSSVLASHFDAIPSSLFAGVVQRISIYEGRVRDAGDGASCAWWTSRYHRWRREERAGLLATVRHVPAPPHQVGGSLAKVGSDVERRLLDRLFRHPPAGRFHAPAGCSTANRVRYKRRWSYFLLFTDFVPPIWDSEGRPREPSELRALEVVDDVPARALLAVYSSTLFWWFFSVYTDNRNVNVRDLAAFPLARLDAGALARLDALGRELSEALRACAEVRTCTYASVGTIRNTYFRQGATRPVIDQVDRELARVYGMADDELRFVLDYERRFRS